MCCHAASIFVVSFFQEAFCVKVLLALCWEFANTQFTAQISRSVTHTTSVKPKIEQRRSMNYTAAPMQRIAGLLVLLFLTLVLLDRPGPFTSLFTAPGKGPEYDIKLHEELLPHDLNPLQQPDNNGSRPEVAWIMSFGGSVSETS